MYSKVALSRKHFPWKARILAITTDQIVIVKARVMAMRLELTIPYTMINDIFYAPNHQLVKLILMNDDKIYISTAQCDIPEKLVSTITYNLNVHRNKIKFMAITNRGFSTHHPITLDSIHKQTSQTQDDTRTDASIALTDRYQKQVQVSEELHFFLLTEIYFFFKFSQFR